MNQTGRLAARDFRFKEALKYVRPSSRPSFRSPNPTEIRRTYVEVLRKDWGGETDGFTLQVSVFFRRPTQCGLDPSPNYFTGSAPALSMSDESVR